MDLSVNGLLNTLSRLIWYALQIFKTLNKGAPESLFKTTDDKVIQNDSALLSFHGVFIARVHSSWRLTIDGSNKITFQLQFL